MGVLSLEAVSFGQAVWRVAVGGLFLLLGTLVTKIIYNIYFHPLRGFPGPFWYRAIRLRYAIAKASGQLPFEVERLHAKYGEVVRIGPDELSFICADAWKDIYGHRQAGQAELDKDARFYILDDRPAHSLLFCDRDMHGRQRRVLSNSFSDKSLREQEPIIKGYIDMLVRRMLEKCDGKRTLLDMVAWYNWTTFDVIGDLSFGEPFGCLRDVSYHPWISMIFGSVKGATIMQASSHYPLLKKLLVSMIPKRLRDLRDGHYAFSREKIERRIQAGGDRPDFFGSIIGKKDEFGMTMDEMEQNAALFIIAGSETTATLLSGVTFYLLSNPDMMKKLEDEILSTFNSDDEINFVTVNKCKYLIACLEEGLRMYPPVPVGLPRVTGKNGVTIAGHFVAGRTVVSVPSWSINHDPAKWKHPWEYRPERFLGGEEYSSDRRDTLQPFSTGPRNCIGRNLATLEMRAILARIIFNFKLEPSEDIKDWVGRQNVFVIWEKVPLKVHVTPRAQIDG